MWVAETKPYATFIHVQVPTGFDYHNDPINNYVLLLILDYLWVMHSSQTSFLEFCCFNSDPAPLQSKMDWMGAG
jgi:hypothetical protein